MFVETLHELLRQIKLSEPFPSTSCVGMGRPLHMLSVDSSTKPVCSLQLCYSEKCLEQVADVWSLRVKLGIEPVT